MTDESIETAAKIIACVDTETGEAPWEDITPYWRDVYRAAAVAVIASLGLTEETAFKYTHLASGRFTIIESTSADVRVARKIAGDTHALTEVSRLVGPWQETK